MSKHLHEQPTPETAPLRTLAPRFESARFVDREVMVDMTQDITNEFPEGVIETDKFTGRLVADLEIGEIDDGGHIVGIFLGQRPNETATIFAITDNGRYIEEVKPGKVFHKKDFSLMVDHDLSALVVEKHGGAKSHLAVSAHIYPGTEPFEKNY